MKFIRDKLSITIQKKKIKSKILSIGSTTDNISTKVKEQYEESPYPRWLSLSIPTSPKLFPIYLNDKKLNILNN